MSDAFFRGSREYIGDPSMSYHSDYHKGPVDDEDDEDEEEEDYSDEDQAAPPVPYKQPQLQAPPAQNPAAAQQYAGPPPTYDVYKQQSYPSGGGAGAMAGAGGLAGAGGMGYDPGYGGYQPPQPTVNIQDPNKSRESNDTFV